MGYWPSKLACILNLIMQIGWGIIGCIIAGQMFSAINGAGLSVAVGCVISALLIGLIATFGIAIVHTIERCAIFIPTVKRNRSANGRLDTHSSHKCSPL